jgi:hypothetical protein
MRSLTERVHLPYLPLPKRRVDNHTKMDYPLPYHFHG